MFCCASSTTSDPLIGADGYDSVVGGRSGQSMLEYGNSVLVGLPTYTLSAVFNLC